jgi:hypothetical protein
MEQDEVHCDVGGHVMMMMLTVRMCVYRKGDSVSVQNYRVTTRNIHFYDEQFSSLKELNLS